MDEKNTENKINKKKWLTWGAVGVFMFFLCKGLLWLALPSILLWWGLR